MLAIGTVVIDGAPALAGVAAALAETAVIPPGTGTPVLEDWGTGSSWSGAVGRVRRWWVAGLVVAVGLCALGLLWQAGGAARFSVRGVSGRAALARLAALPSAEQAVISRTLGGGIPAFAATRTPRGYGLRGGGMRARFGARDASFAGPGGALSLRLAAVGRGGQLEPFAGARLGARGNRVSYRAGGVREWFAAGPLGIEQGFTLSRRPAGGRGPLTLTLASAGLRPQVGVDGARFTDAAGRLVLRYSALAASDASGRALRAWLVVGGGGLEIRVDDAGARYPLRIDPFLQLAKLTASDGNESDMLGFSVAVSGDTVAAGAPVGGNNQQGAVYVFTMPAAGWSDETQAAKLTASDGAANDQLGSSVAISGDTIATGALGAQSHQGAVYVFSRPAAGWSDETQAAKLTASDGAANDELGYSVAISGDTVAAGALRGDGGQGAAYVFTKPAAGWSDETQAAKLTAADGAVNDGLGFSVAVSGDTVAAGAPGTHTSQGLVYVFTMPAAGWADETQAAQLTASDGTTNDELGYSVAISGDTVAAGALFATVDGSIFQGAAYVFTMPAAGWADETQAAKLTAADGNEGDELGFSVAVSGDTVAVGAPFATVGGNDLEGAVYVFTRPAAGWSDQQATRLTASDVASGDQLGFSVAVSGGTVVAGAQLATVGGHSSEGEAWVFGSDSDLALTGVPADITVAATGSSGAVVSYTPPTATDEGGETPSVGCDPMSGSTFPIGTTTVTCTATDSDDSNSPVTATFTVTVNNTRTVLTAAPQLVLIPPGGVGLGTVSATLTSSGEPVVGRTITFTSGGTQLCSAVTGADGTASCSVSLISELVVLLSGSYTGSFAGDSTFLPSSASTPTIELLGSGLALPAAAGRAHLEIAHAVLSGHGARYTISARHARLAPTHRGARRLRPGRYTLTVTLSDGRVLRRTVELRR